jgi:hypothetical protein
MENTFLRMGEFSIRVMPDAPPTGHLKKLIHEAEEAISEPNDIFEYADCILCVFAAAYKSGFSFEDLKKAVAEKVNILENRKWKKTEDGLYQHL